MGGWVTDLGHFQGGFEVVEVHGGVKGDQTKLGAGITREVVEAVEGSGWVGGWVNALLGGWVSFSLLLLWVGG